jgi:hypothetical protein
MMGYLVYRSFGTNFELVGKDYYKDELRYQQVIDGIERANLLHTAVGLIQSADKITLQMPDEMKNKSISGSVLFYCAYDSRKDKKFILNMDSSGIQFFDKSAVTPGTYTVKIDWNDAGKNFYTEKSITIL